jgi:hypothetical protein
MDYQANWERHTNYLGEREVLGTAVLFFDPHDLFGWCQEWRFTLAQYLTDQGECVPDFRGGPGLRDDLSYYEELTAMRPGPDACRYALRILDRYREWLRIAGRDY